jgi:hypothetical protein
MSKNEIRYPDTSELPTISDCKEFYQIALEIKQFILDRIKGNPLV